MSSLRDWVVAGSALALALAAFYILLPKIIQTIVRAILAVRYGFRIQGVENGQEVAHAVIDDADGRHVLRLPRLPRDRPEPAFELHFRLLARHRAISRPLVEVVQFLARLCLRRVVLVGRNGVLHRNAQEFFFRQPDEIEEEV